VLTQRRGKPHELCLVRVQLEPIGRHPICNSCQTSGNLLQQDADIRCTTCAINQTGSYLHPFIFKKSIPLLLFSLFFRLHRNNNNNNLLFLKKTLSRVCRAPLNWRSKLVHDGYRDERHVQSGRRHAKDGMLPAWVPLPPGKASDVYRVSGHYRTRTRPHLSSRAVPGTGETDNWTSVPGSAACRQRMLSVYRAYMNQWLSLWLRVFKLTIDCKKIWIIFVKKQWWIFVCSILTGHITSLRERYKGAKTVFCLGLHITFVQLIASALKDFLILRAIIALWSIVVK